MNTQLSNLFIVDEDKLIDKKMTYQNKLKEFNFLKKEIQMKTQEKIIARFQKTFIAVVFICFSFFSAQAQ